MWRDYGRLELFTSVLLPLVAVPPAQLKPCIPEYAARGLVYWCKGVYGHVWRVCTVCIMVLRVGGVVTAVRRLVASALVASQILDSSTSGLVPLLGIHVLEVVIASDTVAKTVSVGTGTGLRRLVAGRDLGTRARYLGLSGGHRGVPLVKERDTRPGNRKGDPLAAGELPGLRRVIRQRRLDLAQVEGATKLVVLEGESGERVERAVIRGPRFGLGGDGNFGHLLDIVLGGFV